MAHASRLQQSLRALLQARRTAALAVAPLDADPAAAPALSQVPYAIDVAQACLVLHVSALAAHTACMQAHPAIRLLVSAAEVEGEPVHALERASLAGQAQFVAVDSAAWHSARQAYLARFPEAEPMTELPDFAFVAVQLQAARHIAGFGRARDVDAQELAQILAAAS